ncbi:unnamed protein product [Vitrella brassicaformis CCMP3155]|uniref:Fe2OG dioxygenase domain-containing protein n=2 Tax=Vitrella brassicaformis TaxID=1169539 RepID=A0A0G4GBE5_VITBC|nr:unnamed protein product [Vitrella brassicaformis CCMP3155]|mmetsp:Transcript_761/g.1623  ORF Transcript_761/g.1623 Transcript_761/m.1623 type:complete len:397 (+) Transcript_761:110-1300(+)|eukprot:CEM26286.1 unnamed protein product [Vitrella brassicaformis CCMP3155]
MTGSIPTIDLSLLESPEGHAAASRDVLHAMEHVGFLAIKNIPGYDERRLLEAAKWFFDSPLEDKLKIGKRRFNPKQPNIYKGYFPCQPAANESKTTSYKEGLDIGIDVPAELQHQLPPWPLKHLYEPNLLPQADTPESVAFSKTLSDHLAVVQRASHAIMSVLAVGLGLPSDYFLPLFEPLPLSTLRLIHYPYRPPAAADTSAEAAATEGEPVLHCSEHTDSGFLTILATFDFKGLQILTGDGRWVDVPPRPDVLVVNIGDTLAKLSGGRFKATRHRVVDLRQERYSVPFFYEPRYDVDISKPFTHRPLQAEGEASPKSHGGSPPRTLLAVPRMSDHLLAHPQKTPPFPHLPSEWYGVWLLGKIKEFVEYGDVLETVETESDGSCELPPAAMMADA